jgi:glutamate carboxypeptidase
MKNRGGWPVRMVLVLATLPGAIGTALAAERDGAVLAQAERYRTDAQALLQRLVNIDSGTGQAQGLDAIQGVLSTELVALGAKLQTLPATPSAGSNLIARFTGKGGARILMIAHTDTVFAAGTAAQRPFSIQGRRGHGPGVADNKGGAVTGLYALKILHELKFTDYGQITLLLNPNEETGSPGSRALIETLAREHDVALNLEPGREADGVVAWRKGSAVVELEVKGKSAHAGNRPQDGRNAAVELAHQILQMGKLGDAARQTTINFTVMSAGDRSNVIPDRAVAQADARAMNNEEFDRLERDLKAAAANKLVPDTEVIVTLRRSFPPMAQNPRTDALIARAQQIYAEIGRKLTVEGSGGAADSSLTAGVGTPSLDGLGIVGGNLHTAEEYVELDSITPRVYLLTRLLMDLGRQK